MIRAAFDTRVALVRAEVPGAQGSAALSPRSQGWEVLDKKGAHVGIFMGDYFARPTKRSGAWMSAFRAQHKLGKGQSPIIVNVLNFAKGGEGEPALLSLRRCAHAVSRIRTRAARVAFERDLSVDFRDVGVAGFRRAAVTALRALAFDGRKFSRSMRCTTRPESRCRRFCGSGCPRRGISIRASRRSNTPSSALVDMALYSGTASIADVDRLRARDAGANRYAEGDRHAASAPHFMHIMSGYAAGYYSYLWSEVMDADAFAAFEETGNVLPSGDSEEAARVHLLGREPARSARGLRGVSRTAAEDRRAR